MANRRVPSGARAVTVGEELPEAVFVHLQAACPWLGPVDVWQYGGGHSNLTYVLAAASGDYVLRRPPRGNKIKSAHDMGREYRILSKLHGHFDAIPEVVHFCGDDSILGGSFYLMKAIEGQVLRGSNPDGVAADDEQLWRGVSSAAVDTLASLHTVDYQAAGLGDFGKPQGYVQRQVNGWSRRYEAAKSDAIPAVELIGRWLHDQMPATSNETGDVAVIHGDYKYDNLMYNNAFSEIIAVLDWEMATIGEPRMDVGTALSLWVDPDDSEVMHNLAFGPTANPGNCSRQEFTERYSTVSGIEGDWLYYYVFGLFKMAVVFQQIYKRFVDGHSNDPRFERMIDGVRAFSQQGELAIERGRIDRLG